MGGVSGHQEDCQHHSRPRTSTAGLLQPEHGGWRSGGCGSSWGSAPSAAHGGAAVSVRCKLLCSSCCRLPRHCSSCKHCSCCCRSDSCRWGRGLLQKTLVRLLLVNTS